MAIILVVACVPAVAGVHVLLPSLLVPDVLTATGLPAIDGGSSVVGVSVIASVPALAGILAIAVIFIVASDRADPGAPILAGAFTYFTGYETY